MKLQKFFGLTSRSVLEQIRNELGADAVIVANHPTSRGVEISAMGGSAMDALLEEIPAPVLQEQPREPMPAPIHHNGAISSSHVIDELTQMRNLLEGQVAQLAWSASVRRRPMQAQLAQELMVFGYSPALARDFTGQLPDDYTLTQARQWLADAFARGVASIEPESDLVALGGVYALVGPTGVGKTTTTAKLAARCAVRHGSASVALLTTDTYRVGAQDQLRIYAKILGVTVQTVNDANDLRQALDALRSKHLVLIDTVGMGQRDVRVTEHVTVLAQPEVRRLLLLNAAAQGETLEEVVVAYGALGAGPTGGLDGCIITKQDETAQLGQVLDVIIRHRLPVHYVSNGQRVPEDLEVARAEQLVDLSFKRAPQASPFRLRSKEVPLVLFGAGAAHA